MVFRQAPTFEDCFINSEKVYKTVKYDDEVTLQVGLDRSRRRSVCARRPALNLPTCAYPDRSC